MLSKEEPQRHEIISGKDFIEALEKMWGGKLYVSLPPEMETALLDIRQKQVIALKSLIDAMQEVNSTISVSNPTSSVAADFRYYFLQETPHPDRAHDHIHLLACGICRGLFLARLDHFLNECIEKKQGDNYFFRTEDDLPFKISEGKWVMEIATTGTATNFSTLGEYFESFRNQANNFAQILKLTKKEGDIFYQDFVDGVDELFIAIGRFLKGNTTGLHRICIMEAALTMQAFLQRIDPLEKEWGSPVDQKENNKDQSSSHIDSAVTATSPEKEKYQLLLDKLLKKDTYSSQDAINFLYQKLRLLIQMFGYQHKDAYEVHERALEFAHLGNTFLAYVVFLFEVAATQETGNIGEIDLYANLAKSLQRDLFFSKQGEYIVGDVILSNYTAMREMLSTFFVGPQAERVLPLAKLALDLDEERSKLSLSSIQNEPNEKLQQLEEQYFVAESHFILQTKKAAAARFMDKMETERKDYLWTILSGGLNEPKETEYVTLPDEVVVGLNNILDRLINQLPPEDPGERADIIFESGPFSILDIEDLILAFEKRLNLLGLPKKMEKKMTQLLAEMKEAMGEQRDTWTVFQGFVEIMGDVQRKGSAESTEKDDWVGNSRRAVFILLQDAPFFSREIPEAFNLLYELARAQVKGETKKLTMKQKLLVNALDFNQIRFRGDSPYPHNQAVGIYSDFIELMDKMDKRKA